MLALCAGFAVIAVPGLAIYDLIYRLRAAAWRTEIANRHGITSDRMDELSSLLVSPRAAGFGSTRWLLAIGLGSAFAVGAIALVVLSLG